MILAFPEVIQLAYKVMRIEGSQPMYMDEEVTYRAFRNIMLWIICFILQ